MNAVSPVVLEAPAKDYGAVKGKPYTPKSAYFWISFAALVVIAAAFSPFGNSFFFLPSDDRGYAMMWIIAAFVAVLGWGYFADGRQQYLADFHDDMKRRRKEYFNTVVREYIETRYGAKFRGDDFQYIWRIGASYVQVNGEYKNVILQGEESIDDYARGRIDHFYPEDLVLMEVIAPATVSYRQLPTVG